MNFFEHQEKARRNTFFLVIYYFAAVILIACAVYIVFALVLIGYNAPSNHAFTYKDLYQLWNAELFIYCFSGTILVVAAGSVFKIIELSSGGGEAVAIMLGGIKVRSSTTDPSERKVLNVVEEMAIASGIPVPPVFIMPKEISINAFAAGYTRSDAVIGITRGAVQNLTRDELQGVIAHEFSHIVNGDMRLNIRLIGILNGILIIALIGFWTFRMSFFASGSSSSSKKKGGVNVLPFIGLFLMIVGYIGVFFANIIKSAISRQREYLADASAVQYTRNPKGLGNALKKIKSATFGSTISSVRSSEVSHMFFADGLNSFFSAFFATHPPIDKRIARISPDLLNDDASSEPLNETQHSEKSLQDKSYKEFFSRGNVMKLNPEDVVSSIGTPDYRHVAYASEIISGIPSIIQNNMRNPASAAAVIYALLIQKNEKIRALQLNIVKANYQNSVYDIMASMLDNATSLWNGLRLPIIDLCIPSLKEMDAKSYDLFIETIDQLAGADNELSIFEYTLGIVIHNKLDPFFGKTKLAGRQNRGLGSMQDACIQLLSCLAMTGTSDINAAKEAFSKAAKIIYLENAEIIPANQISGSMLDDALSRLTQASPASRKAIVKACISCVISDSKITIEEAELLRAISEVLACPIPPFLPQTMG